MAPFCSAALVHFYSAFDTTCAMRLKAYRGTHIERLYQRLAPGKGHGRAIVAVARHLAEASYWVLRKRQPYKSPGPQPAITDAA